MRGNCPSSSSRGACDFSVHEFPSLGSQGRGKGKDGAQSHARCLAFRILLAWIQVLARLQGALSPSLKPGKRARRKPHDSLRKLAVGSDTVHTPIGPLSSRLHVIP